MKGKILKQLIENKNKYISGQYLSQSLDISRTAVWKYVNALKKQGYEIEGVPNKGYRLVSSPDILTQEEISPLLTTSIMGCRIIHRDTLASTSILAKEIASQQKEGTVVIAEEQSGGRGRLGRQWFSPRGGGIFVSIILKPEIRPDKAYQITQVAAVAAVKAIEDITGLAAGIKWPNDIIVNGKKVCGILTEMNAEADIINHIVLSMGLNVNAGAEDVPRDIKDKAAFLSTECGCFISRRQLMAVLLEKTEIEYIKFLKNGFKATVGDCRKYSLSLGREVRVTQIDRVLRGRAVDITEEGILLLETGSGTVEVISGDVSVRGIDGYL